MNNSCAGGGHWQDSCSHNCGCPVQQPHQQRSVETAPGESLGTRNADHHANASCSQVVFFQVDVAGIRARFDWSDGDI